MPAVPAIIDRREGARLAALGELDVLDTLPEQVFDDIVALAAQICGTPIALVSLVDAGRQWFKARVGIDVSETPRSVSFCAHAIVADQALFMVEDAQLDARFRDNPLVTGDPGIRFYAGAPIVTANGESLGTVCVIDREPRTLDAGQQSALRALSRQTSALLEARVKTAQLQRKGAELQQLAAKAADDRRASAERLDLVLRGANLGLWELDVPRDRFGASDREYEMLGHPRNDKLEWRSLVHPDDWPRLDAAIAPHLRGDTPYYSCEHRMRHADGRWVWVLSHAVIAERDANGAPLRIVGTHLDISARMRDAQLLQRTRELLQRTGRLARVGGWELEVGSGRIEGTDEVYRIHEVPRDTPLELLKNIDYYAPESRATIGAAVQQAIADGTPWDLELAFDTATGRRLTVRTQGEAEREGGQVVRLTGTFQDVTAQRAAERALAASQRRLRLVTDNVPALIAHIDRDERYLFLNAYIGREFGTDVESAIGRTMRETRGDETYAKLEPHIEAVLGGEPRTFVYTQTIGERTAHLQSNYVPDVDAVGTVQGFYALTFDVTELHETQHRLELLAREDTLTGLPNRRQFDETLRGAMLRARRSMRPMAVMFLDVDRFKSINDSLGHAAGDTVLCEVARRLTGCVRVTDLVARLAGDEFVVVLEAIEGVLELGRIADKVVASARPPIAFEGQPLSVTLSAGVAIYRGADVPASELLAQADAALYRAKQDGRNRFALA